MIIYFYKIVNLINNKIYCGIHSTKDIQDGYMGSGVAIKRAIKKYGLKNFSKEIIKYFDNISDAYGYEKMIVNESFVKSENTYNMTLGGNGGFYHIDSKGENNPMFGQSQKQKEIQSREDVRIKKSNAMTINNNERYSNGYINPIKGTNNYWNDESKAMKAKDLMSKNHADFTGEKNTFYGKTHLDTSISKMKASHANRERVECPHCLKIIDISNATRWHLDKCKERK